MGFAKIVQNLPYFEQSVAYVVIYFRTNAIKNIIGNALILHSRIKPRNKDKASRHAYADTPHMSGMVCASTVPPVVGISYLMWYRYTN